VKLLKRKVNLSLGLTMYHAMKPYPVLNEAPRQEGVGVCKAIFEAFLTSAQDGCKGSASRLGRFTPGKDHPVLTG
jgi:hypothetical protein